MLMEILLWPTASAISARTGLPASLAVMSLTVPVVAPVGIGNIGNHRCRGGRRSCRRFIRPGHEG